MALIHEAASVITERFAVLAVLLILAVANLSGQRPAQPAIELIRTGILSDRSRPGFLDHLRIFILRNPSGRFFAISRSAKEIGVFGSGGDIQMVIGGGGTSQPDFGRLSTLLIDRLGRLAAYDQDLQAMTVFSHDLKPHRTILSPFAPAILRDDGTMVVAEQIRTPDLVGYPVHIADDNARIIRSFGIDLPEFRSDLSLIAERIVTPAASGGIWAIAPGRYRLERWNPDGGVRLHAIDVRSSWFKNTAAPRRDRQLRPSPVIRALWDDGVRVWTLIRVADAEWRPPAPSTSSRALDPHTFDREFDWILEAVNPATGAVVASRRLDTYHWAHSPSGLLVARHTNGNVVSLHVLQVRLKTQEEQQ